MGKYNITLFCTVILILLGYVSTLNCTKIVNSCPKTAAEWQRRQVELGCDSMRYTCILDMEKNLVEACMWNSKIKDEMVGCPFIAHCDSINGPILISEDKYFPCQQHGCPESNHTGYSISQMYKYPACYTIAKNHDTGQILTTSKKKYNSTTETNPIDSVNENGVPVYVFLLLVIVSVVFCSVIFIGVIYLRRRSKKEHSSQQTEDKAASKKLMNGPPPT